MVYNNVRAMVVQSLSVLILCALIELGAGFTLKEMKRQLVLLPGLIVMVPPLLDLRGNISGALASRLGTALHVGAMEPKLAFTRELKTNVASSLILSLLASATIGLVSYVMCILTGIETISLAKLVGIALIAGFVSCLILIAIAVPVAVISFKRGLDPDNLTSPLMTTLGDFITVVCIFVAALVVG